MESKYLKHLINNTPIANGADANSPFSFLEWKERLPYIIEKDAVYHYNEYVASWFALNQEKFVSQKFLLRQKYLYLLDQMHLFFSTEEKNTWYRQVNLADEKELLLAIPYFAKKLKDIALYYLNLRKKLKSTKLKYNTVGTVTGLQQEINRYLLETFSTYNTELSTNFYSIVPSFSALQDSLIVQVEELYDDKQYFDLSPTVPLTGYFDFLSDSTSKFLQTKGIVLSSSEWLFESFNIPVTSNFDAFVSQLTGSLFELSDVGLYSDFIQKYLSENKYNVTFTAQTSTASIININLTDGNNYFYYPSGTTDASLTIPYQLTIAALSSLSIGDATAGTSLENSDTMMVRNGNELKSAWLRFQKYQEYSKTMKAVLKKDSPTYFIYPFPGYGLSGQDLPWTGATFETNEGYDFLANNVKASVNNAYWSQTLPNDSCGTIMLNNTTLISSGATASKNPLLADQFYIRLNRPSSTNTPYGELSGAWLYKFDLASFPITPSLPNVLLWPYMVLDTQYNYPEYLTKISFDNVCNPVPIQELTNSCFIAASSIEHADKIYKLNNFRDSTSVALECAWLSGSVVTLNGYRYVQQDSFSALISAGDTIRFVWTGPQATLESVFKSIAHANDCPFALDPAISTKAEWQKCTCRQVYHSPFGHSKQTFQEGNNFADCIVKVTEPNLNPFDITSWKDSTGTSAISSYEFAWYKTSIDSSWGSGKWVSNMNLNQAPFVLETGKAYFYKRANARTMLDIMPLYSVNYKFNTNHTKWIEAKQTNEGEWVEGSNAASSIILRSGDFIKVERQYQTTSYLLSSYISEGVATNKRSAWSVYDYLPVVCGQSNSTTISWPSQAAPFGSIDSQYPPVALSQITSIYGWTITRDEDGESHSVYNEPVVTFVPPTTGTYSISVTANVMTTLSAVTYTNETSAAGLAFLLGQHCSIIDLNVVSELSAVTVVYNPHSSSTIVVSTIIPKISAFDPYFTDYVELKFETPASGFLLETPLKGWNYNTNKNDLEANGARPYWAVLDSLKNPTTRYKGLYSWGYKNEYLDGYLPNSSPEISPIELEFGTILEYFRKGYAFTWKQPIGYQQTVNSTQWCKISADTTTRLSNLSSFYDIKKADDPIVIATNDPSDILLSNIIEGTPVEIFYYALNSFVWPVSVVTLGEVTLPSPSAAFVSQAPWANSSNRFYPTIANIPVVEEIYSAKDVGGYFLPQNLGASQFINKNFTPVFKDSSLSGTYITEDTNDHIGGRGRTKEDQDTIYTWTENNQWLKEPAIAGDLAGAVKKSLTKVYQTFIPYQSNIDETALGLVTPRSRISPWGGLNDEEWTDVNNEPKSFTGVRNVSAWVATQVLKQNEKAVDCWATDVYGNQYGLFKQLNGVPVGEHINVPGELWIKTNKQQIGTATEYLSGTFNQFKISNPTLYRELTGEGIKSIDFYYNTLFIEASSASLFIKIDYDYEQSIIISSTDGTIYNLLNPNFRFDRNWLFSKEKKVLSLYTEISGSSFVPLLYEVDLDSGIHRKVFPLGLDNISNLHTELSSFNIKTISRGVISYNESKNIILLSYTGTNTNNKMFIVNFYIKNEHRLILDKINFYVDYFDSNAINEPPIVLSQYLSSITVASPFSITVSAINNPNRQDYTLLNYTTEVTLISADNPTWNLLFTGTLSPGVHHINYKLSNDIGESIYCLTLSAI